MKACLKLQPDVLFQRIPTNFKIDAYFPSPGCTLSVPNVATPCKDPITEDKENVGPISSRKRDEQGSSGSRLKAPYKDKRKQWR